MIESLTATALFSSYISSSYCGLGAVTVRNEERKDDVTAPIPQRRNNNNNNMNEFILVFSIPFMSYPK